MQRKREEFGWRGEEGEESTRDISHEGRHVAGQIYFIWTDGGSFTRSPSKKINTLLSAVSGQKCPNGFQRGRNVGPWEQYLFPLHNNRPVRTDTKMLEMKKYEISCYRNKHGSKTGGAAVP